MPYLKSSDKEMLSKFPVWLSRRWTITLRFLKNWTNYGQEKVLHNMQLYIGSDNMQLYIGSWSRVQIVTATASVNVFNIKLSSRNHARNVASSIAQQHKVLLRKTSLIPNGRIFKLYSHCILQKSDKNFPFNLFFLLQFKMTDLEIQLIH